MQKMRDMDMTEPARPKERSGFARGRRRKEKFCASPKIDQTFDLDHCTLPMKHLWYGFRYLWCSQMLQLVATSVIAAEAAG